jgi:hypothetical protein
MSALSPFYPQLRTLVGAAGTAASCHNRSHALQQTAPLFDHPLGGRKQRRRHGEAEHPGSLVVDHQLELGRLHDRQVSRLGALEDATGIDADLTIRVR